MNFYEHILSKLSVNYNQITFMKHFNKNLFKNMRSSLYIPQNAKHNSHLNMMNFEHDKGEVQWNFDRQHVKSVLSSFLIVELLLIRHLILLDLMYFLRYKCIVQHLTPQDQRLINFY